MEQVQSSVDEGVQHEGYGCIEMDPWNENMRDRRQLNN